MSLLPPTLSPNAEPILVLCLYSKWWKSKNRSHDTIGKCFYPSLGATQSNFCCPKGLLHLQRPTQNKYKDPQSWLNSCRPFSRMHLCNPKPKFYLVLSFVRKNYTKTWDGQKQSLRKAWSAFSFQIIFFMSFDAMGTSFLQDFASAGRSLWCSSNSMYRAPSSTPHSGVGIDGGLERSSVQCKLLL